MPSAEQTDRHHAEFSFADLVQAYIDCRQLKRNSTSALAFEQRLEANLCQLDDELRNGSYRPGKSICFVITRPKPREVWAADFRDRIVHHLLYNRISPRFYASFIADSCACIPGRGTLYGAQRLEAKVRSITQNWSKPAFYLKLDLANFFVSIDKLILRELDARHVAAWRDRRLTQVSAASVRREWNLLSNACTIAVKEWKWLKENPMREVRRPPPTDARDRIATDEEIERILFCLGYTKDEAPTTASARVGASVLFAIETGMRAGEITGLRWDRVFLDKAYCNIIGGKTASAKRDVPLSAEAMRIIQQMPADSDILFNISTTQIDALFRKARAKALVEGLTFHDLRHTAITRLAKKLDVLALARMVGHRDLKMLMVYYNETAENLAKRL